MATILTRVPVAVEKIAAGRFIARADVAAVKLEAEDAVAKLQAEALSPPTEPAAGRLEPFRMCDHPNPWVAMAGAFKDDPLMPAWRQAMADRRAELAAQERPREG